MLPSRLLGIGSVRLWLTGCCAFLWPVIAPAATHPNTCLPAPQQVIVRFLYGAEKAAWIYDVTKDFNAAGIETISGQRICVNAIPDDSGDGASQIQDRAASPDEIHAASPTSELAVNLINYDSEAEGDEALLEVSGFLVRSPLVIAAWEPVVEGLGGADDIGWGQIFERAGESDIRYGQTSPEHSSSGLAALVAQFVAGAQSVGHGQVGRLSRANIADPQAQAFVAKVHDSVIHYGDSIAAYAGEIAKVGPAYADAVLLHESDVIEANNQIRNKQLGFPRLMALYPAEGTFVSNHPYAIVNRDWVDADEKEGAEKYFEYLMSPPVQAQALQYGFRPGVPLELDSAVYDQVWNSANGTAPFDTEHRFLAAPSGELIKAARDAFPSIKNSAMVYLVIDRSGSMNQQVLDPERQAMRSRMAMAAESVGLLTSGLRDKDRLALLLYNFEVDDSELTPEGQPIAMTAAGKQQLRDALNRTKPEGGSAVRNAIGRAWTAVCKHIKRNPADRSIRLIVVLTDGEDNASAISTERLIDLIGYAEADGEGGYRGDATCKIPVFGIAFGAAADAQSLSKISEATGGQTHRADAAEIREIFRRLGDLL